MESDLLKPPPLVAYHDLAAYLASCEEKIEWISKKSQRQGVFIAQVADYLHSKTVIGEFERQFILECISKHFDIEHQVLRERITKATNPP